MPPIVTVTNLSKQYGDFHAVKGISFQIAEGEIFSLLGPNGAGKTTTISILSTLLKPTGGGAEVCGASIADAPMEVRRQIGVVPQEIALYDSLSARENLRFWGRLYGMGGASLNERVDEVLQAVGLLEKANQRVRTFSGGMKRRVNIGVGLLHRPRLVFMDEPTVGIDPQSRRAILDTVKDLNRQGMTVLYTTHYMEEAQELSHRVGIMDHGELIALGTQPELTRSIGEQETLILALEDPTQAPLLAQALEQRAGVAQASASVSGVVISVPDAQSALAPVIDLANRMGSKVRAVELKEPNLEAVFLHLTGRALRD